jgi:hypothetical protein
MPRSSAAFDFFPPVFSNAQAMNPRSIYSMCCPRSNPISGSVSAPVSVTLGPRIDGAEATWSRWPLTDLVLALPVEVTGLTQPLIGRRPQIHRSNAVRAHADARGQQRDASQSHIVGDDRPDSRFSPLIFLGGIERSCRVGRSFCLIDM